MNSVSYHLHQISGFWFFLFAGVYFLFLLVLSLRFYFKSEKGSLSDFFLAGRNLSFFPLALTSMASLYSATTLVGFSAKAYRTGFSAMAMILLMLSLVGFSLLIAPKIYALSQKNEYITISDFFSHRFQSEKLSFFLSLALFISMLIYITVNLKAVLAIASLQSFFSPFAILSIVVVSILIYEMLGGCRSVVWSDAIQGLIMLAGCWLVFFLLFRSLGGFDVALQNLQKVKPEFWEVPKQGAIREWLSAIFIIGIGASIFPHSIQRIFAARSKNVLRGSFCFLAITPLLITLPILFIGIFGHLVDLDLGKTESEGVVIRVLYYIVGEMPHMTWAISLFGLAIFAAIMSTLDSVLLAMSGFLTKNVVLPFIPKAKASHTSLITKLSSLFIMLLCVGFALSLPKTIWLLTLFQGSLLVQCFPAVLIGLYSSQRRVFPVFLGFIAGMLFLILVVLANSLGIGGISLAPYGFGVGAWALLINCICIACTWSYGIGFRKA